MGEEAKFVNTFTTLLRDLDALLITHPANVRYLTGFPHAEGAWLWIDDAGPRLLASPLYENDLKNFALPYLLGLPKDWPRLLAERARDRVGFEKAHLSYGDFQKLSEALKGVELVPTEGRVEALRLKKRPEEVVKIRRAMEIARAAYREVVPEIRPGAREREVAAALECAMRRRGAEGRAFPTIVASGENGAFPHAGAGEKPLREGELVTLDFGARYAGYHSDVTRTLPLGEVAPELSRLLRAVQDALSAALEHIGPGRSLAEPDRAARAVLEAEGLLRYYPHALGHGVGLEVHESPRISHESRGRFEPGMVVTIEPGVYIPGLGGARVEELVLITENGFLVLSDDL